ncbi:MAG: class I SAM-dependent RNA methyltransferase [Acidimicrobiales bacterium]|nr:class I SAM-dependent RNA methyltransferase [Acidimicrobiales bacterium]
MTTVELRTTSMAVGGEAVAREPSGRVVFVSGAAPDEVVRVEIDEEHRSFARGTVVEVLEPSADRVVPPCPHRLAGCGGCDWQHITPDAQSRLRTDLVRAELRKALRTDDPVVDRGPAVPGRDRTTVRGLAGPGGRFSYRRRRSNDPVPVDSCLVADPLVEEIIAEGSFGSAASVTIRVGARTGERMVVVDGDTDEVEVPDDVVVVSESELKAGHRAWLHEEAAGRRWRVSAQSFFQAGPAAAEALVDVVGAALAEHAPDGGTLVDLWSGVGLFAGTVGAGWSVVAVERSSSAVADARVNLAGADVRLVRSSVERWRSTRADVVVADPARSGLRATGVRAIDRTGAKCCVAVHCDVGSLRRDTELMVSCGFEHRRSVTLDLFAHTGQVETVSLFTRS